MKLLEIIQDEIDSVYDEGKKYFPKLKVIDNRFYLNYPKNKGSFSLGSFKDYIFRYKRDNTLRWMQKQGNVSNIKYAEATGSLYFKFNNKNIRISDHKKQFDGEDILIQWNTSPVDIANQVKSLK